MCETPPYLHSVLLNPSANHHNVTGLQSVCLITPHLDVTSAQYCCLVSESICAKPPSTRAFIRDLCTELDSRWRGGLRLANCFARFHQLSHCTTMLALNRPGGRGVVTAAVGRRGKRIHSETCCITKCPASRLNLLLIPINKPRLSQSGFIVVV